MTTSRLRYPEDWLQRDDLDVYQGVARRVGELQRRSTDEHVHDSDVAARLARLRRAVNADPGGAPDIWSDTIEVVPPRLWGTETGPSVWEVATHAAVTLFAIHMQGSATAVHRKGPSLGAAVRRFAGHRSADADQPDLAVFKRFQALATAVTGGELRHHLRSMITLFRGSGTQLDYGLLAVDIHGLLRSPRAADAVRLRWGRDYHRVAADNDDSSATSTD